MLAVTLTSFVAVIDRLIQLVDRREKLSRSTFTDFVAPVMADLDTVHKDYLDSFRRYYATLDNKSIPLSEQHPVFADIDRDIRLSQNLMLKARALALREDLDSKLRPFAISIDAYFAVTSYQPQNANQEIPESTPVAERALFLQRNLSIFSMARTYFFHELSNVVKSANDDATKRKDAFRILDESTTLLQRNYGRVFIVFNGLKTELLQPI
jgi:hypothetical protein